MSQSKKVLGFVSKSLLAIAAHGVIVTCAASAQAVGTRRIAFRTGDDFASGKLEGVAVDSSGQVRAGLALSDIPIAQATTVWAALDLGNGTRLLATGNEGKLIEVGKNGESREVAKADALALTSIVRGFKGAILVGSLPNGKIFEYKDGKLVEWLTLPETKHVFQLAFDEKNQALYAATGPEGRLFRITADKKPQVYFDAPEQHIQSLALTPKAILIGTGDKAKLYEVTGPGRANILHDFGKTEVRSIAVAANGDVFAIANEIRGQKFPPDPNASGGTKGNGVLYRFEGGKIPEQLFDNDDEYFTSLALDGRGRPYVGTGVEGKVYTVDENRNSVLVADVAQRQVSGFVFTNPNQLIIASDPIVLHPVLGVGGDATWTSKVIDAGIRAHFGRLSWIAEGTIEFETRSGNSSEPDDTWSSWSKPMTQPKDVESPAARFLQLRAHFQKDRNAVLREVVIPLRTDNLRAVVTRIDAQSAASKALSAPDGRLVASGGPTSSRSDDEIELSWGVDNPDKDELRYRLEYRFLEGADWISMLAPREKLTKASYTWRTRDLPEGRYRVRVSVSDEPSNSPELVKRHQLESHVITVDNTPPRLLVSVSQPKRLKIVANDGVGPIQRVEIAVAGSDEWIPLLPDDGVYDESSELFDVDLNALGIGGPGIVTLRAFDLQNNQVVQGVVVP